MQIPQARVLSYVGDQLARLRILYDHGGVRTAEIGTTEMLDYHAMFKTYETFGQVCDRACVGGTFVENVPHCSAHTHALLPNGTLVCFANEYRLAIHAFVSPTMDARKSLITLSTTDVSRMHVRTYYSRYYPQGVSMQLLRSPFVHPGPETPFDTDVIILNNTSSASNASSSSSSSTPLNHPSTSSARHASSDRNRTSTRDASTDPSVSSSSSTPNPPPSTTKITPVTPDAYVIKKLQPISDDEYWQPHRVVQRYWTEHNLQPPLPWWLVETFKACFADRSRSIPLYLGLKHYYVWHPFELQNESQYDNYRAYCLIVNRVHWIEHLFERERQQQTTLPRYIIQCLMCMQDQHHFLQLLMCETHWFSDEQLLTPVEHFVPGDVSTSIDGDSSSEPTNDSTKSDPLLLKWQTLRRVRDRMHDNKRWDASQIPQALERDTILDMYMPSYDLVFHEGELPDLTLLLILIGTFNIPNRADRPVQITAEILPLMNLMWKALPMPMKLRDHTRASSEKTQDSQLTFECQLRMVMAFYGGYYANNRVITSFFTRHHLYRDLAYRQCSRKDFCNFLVGHYTHDATRQGVIAVKHKHLSLVFVKTYLFNMIIAVPSMHDMMSARYVGHRTILDRTLRAVDRCLQTREDMWFGSGEQWDRFERTYNMFVEREERLGSKRRMTLCDGDGNEIDMNDAHRSQSAKRRVLEPRAGCPFVFKRHKATSRTRSGKGNKASDAVASEESSSFTRVEGRTNTNEIDLNSKNNALAPAPPAQQPALRANLYTSMRGFICGCVRFLLDQLVSTQHLGVLFQCVMYDDDHLDCDFDWFGRRGEQISVTQVLEQVRSGQMTCDAAVLCITVAQERVVHHYLQVTQQKGLPQYAASRMTNRCKFLITARLMRDMRVRFPATGQEPAQYVSDKELVAMYCSDVDRVPEGIFTDHRALTFPLHARSLLFHNHKSATRCLCYQCHPLLPPAMRYETHDLYRILQQQLSTGALWSITMSAPSMDLCEAIIHQVYHENLEYMYRAPTTSFVDNVVHSMNIAREDSRNNERFVRAAARITESERRLIAAYAARTNPWSPVQYEWFGNVLRMDQYPLKTLRNAEHMFNTHTYPVDVSTTIRDMPLRYPREFLLLEQLFTEIYCRRMVQVHRLPYEWTRQQVRSAHERLGIVPLGAVLPLKMFEAYFCPHHGDIKRHIAQNDPQTAYSIGCTTSVGLDCSTGRMYCTNGFKRGVARAAGAHHHWRTTNDRKVDQARGGGYAYEDASLSTNALVVSRHRETTNSNLGSDGQSRAAPPPSSSSSSSTTVRPIDATTTLPTSDNGDSSTFSSTLPPPPPSSSSAPSARDSTLASFVSSLVALEDDDDDSDAIQMNCAADVFMSAVSSVSGAKEGVSGGEKKRKQKGVGGATTRKTSRKSSTVRNTDNSKEANDVADPLDEYEDGDIGVSADAPFSPLTQETEHDDGGFGVDDIEQNMPPSTPHESQHSSSNPNRRSDKRYELKKYVRRNRGRGPSEFSYQRYHLERLAERYQYQKQMCEIQQERWNHNAGVSSTSTTPSFCSPATAPNVRQHRYRQAFQRLQNTRCNSPLESVCLLGHTLVLYGATFLACPVCNTTFRLQWSSFTDAYHLPLCGLCVDTKERERQQYIGDHVYVACHCCTANSAIHKPEETVRHLVLDNTTPGPHYWRYIYLCAEHNREHIGDCESNSVLSNLELYIAHCIRYIYMDGTYADNRPMFATTRDDRTNPSHPFPRGEFVAQPDALTSAMNAVDNSSV